MQKPTLYVCRRKNKNFENTSILMKKNIGVCTPYNIKQKTLTNMVFFNILRDRIYMNTFYITKISKLIDNLIELKTIEKIYVLNN